MPLCKKVSGIMEINYRNRMITVPWQTIAWLAVMAIYLVYVVNATSA